MKIILTAALLVAISSSALATEKRRSVTHRFTEYADVVDVQPVYRDVSIKEPRRECWVEQQRHLIRQPGSHRSNRTSNQREYRHQAGTGDTLIGGIIGGVIGNQLGRKGGRGARAGATVAGAIIGSVIANEAHTGNARHRREQRHSRHYSRPQPVYETRPVERCKKTYHTRYEQRADGYDVTYRYRDHLYTTHMKNDPGRQIELQINVKPARR